MTPEEAMQIVEESQNSRFSRVLTMKDIFSSYEIFMALWEHYKVADIQCMNSEEESKILYNTLYNYFCNSSTIYDTIDAFCRYFYLDIYNYGDYYFNRNTILDAIQNLDVDKLKRLYQNVTNSAQNNNELTNDPLNDIIKFISNQNVSYTDGNEFDAILKKLNTLRMKYVDELIDTFRRHFVFILDDPICLYKGGCPHDLQR